MGEAVVSWGGQHPPGAPPTPPGEPYLLAHVHFGEGEGLEVGAGGTDGRGDALHQQLLHVLAEEGPGLCQDLRGGTQPVGGMQGCRDGRMQGCRDGRMQGWEDAGMHRGMQRGWLDSGCRGAGQMDTQGAGREGAVDGCRMQGGMRDTGMHRRMQDAQKG